MFFGKKSYGKLIVFILILLLSVTIRFGQAGPPAADESLSDTENRYNPKAIALVTIKSAFQN